MLSQEKRNAMTAAETAIAYQEAARAARMLGKALATYDRNPDPMKSREARNPAHGVRIRVLKPNLNARVNVDEETKRHNARVQNLGVEPL
jgi:hypothetical protein